MRRVNIWLVFTFWLLAGPATLFADDFYCEVLSLEGTATVTNSTDTAKLLQEGDLLKVDDLVEVSSGSYVDLAYDKDWNNVTRIEEDSRIRLKSLYPTTVEIDKGGIYAKLKSLPKDSTFDVKTPTAIASVRGTEYRTTVLNGETEVYNFSDSDVFVYGVDESGQQQDTPVILANTQKTQVQQRGRAPIPPRAMEQRDFQPVERFRQGIEKKIQDNVARGRVGKIQDIQTVERFHDERRQRENKVFSDKDVERASGGALRSDGTSSGRGGREPVKALSGDEARRSAEKMTGGNSEPDRKQSDRAGEGFDRGRSVILGEDNFKGRGLGQPYFPSDEKTRSGGPMPAGFPNERWKSGFDGNTRGGQMQAAEGDRKDGDRVRAPGGANGPDRGGMQRPGPDRSGPNPPNGKGPGGGNQPKGQGGQARGGSKPGGGNRR